MIASAPVSGAVPLMVAESKGFFEDEGLDVTLKVFPTSAPALVVSGQVDFGVTATSQVSQQRANGVPFKMVAGLDFYSKDESTQVIGLMAKGDSPIRSASDLAGKTVGLPGGVHNNPELVMRKWLKLHGVDASTVKFVPVNIPALLTTLKGGDVDAALVLEPFVAQAVQQGNRVVAYPYAEATPDVMGITVFGTDKYLQSHPDVPGKVYKALQKASEYANAHPDEVRALLVKEIKVPAELATKMQLNQYRTEINEAGVEDEVNRMVELGWIKERPSLKDLIWDHE